MDQEPMPSQSGPVIPPSTPPARKFNPFLILVALVLLIIVGVGGLILGKSLNTSQKSAPPTATPTPLSRDSEGILRDDETTNWKIYTNSKFGISFKYPDRFNFSEEPASQDFLFRVHFGGSQSQSVGFNVEIWQEDVNEAIQKIKDRNDQASVKGTITRTETQFNNLSATKLVLTSSALETQVSTFVIKQGSYSYILIFQTLPNDYMWVDQILSTFKFTSP